jgi:outer membrane protein OmpA-like peptidoglycan-associated protein
VTIIIPSQQLFIDYSVAISGSGDAILRQIVELLKPMNKVKITIAAYAAAPLQSEKDLFLTEKQAQTVSNYFWGHEVDARIIYAVGYGGGHPVQYQPNLALNDVVGDYSNYRVEITLKDYVA